MSARQAFTPRPPSSEAYPHPTDMHDRDGDNDMFLNGNGKARSIVAFLGHKRGTEADAPSQGARSSQGPGLNAGTQRRSFDGILRPEMSPMSIIPYPAAKQHISAGGKQSSAGQTPRKPMGQDPLEFPRPLTPASMPRGPKKGFRIFAEGREENIANGNASGFMGTRGDADVCVDETGGYMRVLEGPGSGRNAGVVQPSLEDDIAAPVAVRAVGHGANADNLGCEAENAFARSSRSLDAMSETEVGMEKNSDSQRSFGGTKRGMRAEDVEENGWYVDGGYQTQRLAKRMRQVQHDPDEYLPISSPHVPPTPAPQTSSIDVLDPSMIAGVLFENIREYINLEEIETDWKRWRDCSTDEWLKGADRLAQEYTDILNMVKDHLTEKVMAYANMISSVEERQTELKRNIESIHAKGEVVRENASHLSMRK